MVSVLQVRWLAVFAVLCAACGAEPVAPAEHGPIDVWVYADPEADPWKRVDVDAHRRAIAILDEITGMPGCFRLVEQEWTGGEVPGGVVVSVVDTQRVWDAEGDDVDALGLADLRTGELVMKANSRTWGDAIAHELAHFPLGTDWGVDGHDEWGLMAPSASGDTDVPEATRDALRAFCRTPGSTHAD